MRVVAREITDMDERPASYHDRVGKIPGLCPLHMLRPNIRTNPSAQGQAETRDCLFFLDITRMPLQEMLHHYLSFWKQVHREILPVQFMTSERGPWPPERYLSLKHYWDQHPLGDHDDPDGSKAARFQQGVAQYWWQVQRGSRYGAQRFSWSQGRFENHVAPEAEQSLYVRSSEARTQHEQALGLIRDYISKLRQAAEDANRGRREYRAGGFLPDNHGFGRLPVRQSSRSSSTRGRRNQGSSSHPFGR